MILAAWLLLGCTPAPQDSAVTETSLSAATLNLLHGITCGSGYCRLEERARLLVDWLAYAGCPDVVALQEIWGQSAALLEPMLGQPCGFAYTLHAHSDSYGPDEEVYLSRYPIDDLDSIDLQGDFRHVLHGQLDHPAGPVDLFATHLSSGSDGGPDPCEGCPDQCVEAGAVTKRDCQAVQLAALVAEQAGGPALVMGDLNDPPGSFLSGYYADLGWVDSWLAAGHAECDPASGAGCTSGREDEALDDMEDPALNQSERIDYVYMIAMDACALEPAGDGDGDGLATGGFAHLPNPGPDSCGPSPEPICWPSDHSGVLVDLECD